MDLKLSVYGCQEISDALAKLPDDLQDKYGARGLEAAAEMTVMAVRDRMPVATGLARESIGHTLVKYYKHSGTLFTAIQPLKGFKRIVTISPSGKARIHRRRTTSVTADLGRVQDPRRYMHLVERGRKDITPVKGRALHAALSDRFFTRAKAALPHPVFGPARDAVMGSAKTSIEIELNKGIEEWNARHLATES